MKILIYGAGVLGSYLAHTLICPENDVYMLARRARYEQLKKNGLVIQHYFQKKRTVQEINVVPTLEESDYYDIIFVVMQAHQFHSVLPILAANVSENIVLVGNNAEPTAMRDFILNNSTTKKNVAFGFQISAGMRDETGCVTSIHGGGNALAGELGDTENVFPQIKKAFGDKYKVTYQKDIESWLKTHYIGIIPMNAVTYLHDFDVLKLSKDMKSIKRMTDATAEGLAVMEKIGYSIIPASQGKLFRQFKGIYNFGMKIYHKLPMARVVQGSFHEINGLYEAFDKLKEQANIPTPVWDSLQKEALNKYQAEINGQDE